MPVERAVLFLSLDSRSETAHSVAFDRTMHHLTACSAAATVRFETALVYCHHGYLFTASSSKEVAVFA